MHVRSHFYVYSTDLRYLPTDELEETLEFLACVAHGAALDGATKMVILDALNTFTEDPESVGREYTGFENQAELDNHLSADILNPWNIRRNAILHAQLILPA